MENALVLAPRTTLDLEEVDADIYARTISALTALKTAGIAADEFPEGCTEAQKQRISVAYNNLVDGSSKGTKSKY